MGPAKFNEIILRVYLVNYDDLKSKTVQEKCNLWFDNWNRNQLVSYKCLTYPIIITQSKEIDKPIPLNIHVI